MKLPPEWEARIREQARQEREGIADFVEEFARPMSAGRRALLSPCGIDGIAARAFRAVARSLEKVPPASRKRMLTLHYQYGDHWRQEVGDPDNA